MELSSKTVYGPVLKTTQLSARAQNHARLERAIRILMENLENFKGKI